MRRPLTPAETRPKCEVMKDENPGPTPHPVTMFHDGACPLCSQEVAYYRRTDADGRIRFCDAADPRTAADLAEAGLTQEAALKRLHVRRADGRVVSGARAFVEVWRQLPGWRHVAPIASAPPVIWMLELGYRMFLPFRPVVAKLMRREPS